MKKERKVVIIICKCSKNSQTYGIRFERTGGNNWVGNWAFAIKEQSAKKEGYDQGTISGTFGLTEEYPGCPSCKHISIFKCMCGKVSCWDGESKKVKCPWCNKLIAIGGVIESLSSRNDL